MDNGASSYRRYLDGDEAGFRHLVELYCDPLIFFINRYVNDLPAAEDIALDVFTDLVVHRRRYNFKVSMKTYLFMIGRSRALDHLKHRKKLQMLPLGEAENLPSQKPTPEELFLADERRRAIHHALGQLNREQQEVLHLVYFEELSCEAAAKVLKKNVKQVYNLLYRGKNGLRTILGKEGEDFL